MNNLSIAVRRLKLAITCTVAAVLASTMSTAQTLTPVKKGTRVEITQGPALESARDSLAIIRWTTTNPGGLDDHFAVVRYGTDPKDLSMTAKSHIRLNRAHPETIFRVRVDGLKPRQKYYYKASSIASDGTSDGVESSLNSFTTPGHGERIDHPLQPTPGSR